MKKYWKLTIVVIVISFGIGTFYVQSATLGSEYPEFIMDKISGDETEVKPLTISASYHVGPFVVEGLRVTAGGSLYDRNEYSFFDRFEGVYWSPSIERLQRDYRTFMRGKGNDPSMYFEDVNYLAYVDTIYDFSSRMSRTNKLSVAVLDKKDGKTYDSEISVPNTDKYDFMDMADVQVVAGELKVITRNYLQNGKGMEIHVYSFDDAYQLDGDEKIAAFSSEDEMENADISLINETDQMQTHNYVVFNKVVTKMKPIVDPSGGENAEPEAYSSEVDYIEEEVSKELIAYNLKTKTKETIDLPESIDDQATPAFFDGNNIYFMRTDENGFTVMPYDIAKKKNKTEINVKMESKDTGMGGPLLKIKKDKLYVVSGTVNKRNAASVVVADLNTGKTLYEGRIIPKTPPEINTDFDLYMGDIVIGGQSPAMLK